MSKTIFTESQKKAHDICRNLSVTANAGSGKTTVLVSRYLDILLNTETKIDEIIAITFTEKAGAELKKKISDSIDDLIKIEANNNRLRKIEYIRDHLSFGNISTIHSFCAKLLRLYPVEANIDFAFTILEGMDKNIIENEAIDEAINNALTNSDSDGSENIKQALRSLKKNQIKNFIKSLLLKREQLNKILDAGGIYKQILDKENNKILTEWNRIIQNYIMSIVNNSSWKNDFQNLLDNIKPEKAKQFKSSINSWDKSINDEEKLNILNEIFSELLTQKFEIRKNVLIKDFNQSNVDLRNEKLGAFWKSLRDLVAGFIESNKDDNQKRLLDITHTILLLYNEAENIYEQKKAEKSHLDYEDLQLKTRYLLANEEIREKLSQKYKYIMIDEFQDTNFLQYEIFLPLLNEFKSGNLFIVGDPKQSIYAFRNAEVEVFNKTKVDIASSSKPNLDLKWLGYELESTDNEKRGLITLGESFRLLTDIVCFVNLVFSKIMKKSNYEFEVEYEELVKGRNNPAHGGVELMLLMPENDQKGRNKIPTKELISEECEMIAKRILNLHEMRYQIFDKTENSHDFKFKDAAILLRSRNQLKILEQYLNGYKIPYVISGGIGFYQTQEIYDFFNYFQFLLNNHDDIALVGVMRSPFFSIADSELFKIASVNKSEDFWTKVKIFSKESKSSEQLRRCVNILSDNIQYANRLPIPILVQRIMNQTGWLGTIAGVPRGDQSRLNVEKLLRIAREFEGKGFTNLFDFIERLKSLIDMETREGQASLEVEGNAVQVMTIHAAKGLEFPVVFIPFCHNRFTYDTQPFIDNNVGMGFEISEEMDIGESIQPLTYLFLKHKMKSRNIAEEKRIFYVACTRAKDLLILSGNNRGETESYLSWILEGLNIEKSTLLTGEIGIPGIPVKILAREDDRYLLKEISHDFKINIITKPEDIKLENDYSRFRASEKEIGDLFLEPLQARIHKDFFSATQIQTYLECPLKYYLKHKLGLPQQKKVNINFDENEDANDLLKGEVTGLLYHEILEKYHQYNETEFRKFVSEFYSKNSTIEELGDKQRDDILKSLNEIYKSDFIKNIFSIPQYKSEFTINTVFYDDYLTGTMDFIYKSDDNWSIVDYKTDNISLKSITDHTKKYIPQLKFYALLVSRLFKQKNVTAFLLFTRFPDKPQKLEFTEADINEYEKIVFEIIQKIKNDSFAHNKKHCEYCPYFLNNGCIKEVGS